MAYAATNPLDVPPYQIQPLISRITAAGGDHGHPVRVSCAQAQGSEIYVGCTNGELFRFALQADDPNTASAPPVTKARRRFLNSRPVARIIQNSFSPNNCGR
jgi:hypothetical protein